MNKPRTRYPGAQPFSDDSLSSSVFFGREREIVALTDQIVANRLVVVYAKSGVGKTSLLQAGVCPPLRDDGYVPLVVRVNDIQRGPFRGVLDGVRTAAERHGLEYNAGSELSLWHFFKTAEFWRGDLLLTPVLILDQFEELFTLHTPETRADFLSDFGYLIRGVKPEVAQRKDAVPADGIEHEKNVTDTAPQIRVVISLREDFLGFLEEAADRIPQILDQRFRLTPLTVEAATAALHGPSRVEDDQLATQPFTYKPETAQAILEYLSRTSRSGAVSTAKYVEPFQLQLVCQRVEAHVMERQRQAHGPVEITLADVGGENGLSETLRDFYGTVLYSIPSFRNRRKVGRLCSKYLISPSGRRLSLEEGEVERLTGVRRETLASLVDHRLLRSDQRAESFYYELSHDSLVEPVLAKNRVSMTSFGLVQLVASLTMCITALIFFVVPTAKTVKPEERVLAFIFVLPFAISLGWLGIKGIRRSTTTLALFWQKSAGYRSPLVWAIAGYVGLILVIGVVYLPWNHDPIHYQLLEWAVVLVGVAATWKLLHMRSSAVPLFLTGFLMEIVVQVTKTMDTSLPHKELSVILLIWLFILIDSAIVYYVLRLRRMNLLK
jgi:hypothetical protein